MNVLGFANAPADVRVANEFIELAPVFSSLRVHRHMEWEDILSELSLIRVERTSFKHVSQKSAHSRQIP